MKKRIGVLTSGGNYPGLDAAIRAVFYRASETIWSFLKKERKKNES